MPTTERMSVMPALPRLPRGAKIVWCGEYIWDDPTRIEVWAKKGSQLIVSEYDPVSGQWGEWTPNQPDAA